MATNKWESQFISKKFKNKHKKIIYAGTRRRNKRRNRRKNRSFNKIHWRHDLFEGGILNIKKFKGSKTQYSNQKTITTLHPKSSMMHQSLLPTISDLNGIFEPF